MIIMKEVMNVLNANLNSNDTIIVACSTGPDSMCLLSLVMQLNLKIIVAHVNHNVRNQSSEEYDYLEKYCNDNNLIFEGLTLNNLSTQNFEAIARNERYKFFNNLKDKYQAKFILTAHHADDLIETILMRISRGSNLSGYAGIKLIDHDYFRPLLYTEKEKILEYLRKNNIKYYIDVTNNEDGHTRNRYRHNIVPLLKKETSDIYSKYVEFSNELLEYDVFVKNYISNKQIFNKNFINLDLLIKEPKFIQKKSIEMLIAIYQKYDTLNVSKNVINEIINLVNNKKINCSIDLNNNYQLVKEYNKIIILNKNKKPKYMEVFDTCFSCDEWTIQKNDSHITNNYVIRLNSKELEMPLIVRTKQDGDIIKLKNSGHKKIKNIFIDEKIAPRDREAWPIVTDSNGTIIWIPGLKKSEFDKNINEKYDIILTSERKITNE